MFTKRSLVPYLRRTARFRTYSSDSSDCKAPPATSGPLAIGICGVLLYCGYTYFTWETNHKLNLYENKGQMSAVFDLIDQDKNGFINKTEFKSFLEQSGLRVGDSMVDNILKDINLSQDGRISRLEWTKLCERSPILNPKRLHEPDEKKSFWTKS